MSKYVIPNIWGGKPGNAPGIGHEFRLWLTGYNIADYYGLKFVHSPFCGDHTQTWDGVGRIDVPVKEWENFLDFGSGELKQEDLPDDINIVHLSHTGSPTCIDKFAQTIQARQGQNNTLFICPHNQFLPMRWSIYKHNRFRDKYWSKRQKSPVISHFSDTDINVAVHIRRCDVTPQKYAYRFQSNDYYFKVLQHVLSIYPQAKIHIYSDTKSMNEFPQFVALQNVEYHLQTNVFETFHAFVSADILVMDRGSFSLIAAYLARGVKLTTEWHSAWGDFPNNEITLVKITREGDFDTEKLKIAVKDVI